MILFIIILINIRLFMTKHLIIDLIPLLPGGQNGGAKLVALNLIQGFQQYIAVDRTWQVTLLTAPWNQAELEQHTNDRITCKTLQHLTQGHPSLSSLTKKIHYKVSQLPIFPSLLTKLKADLFFCPFSNPTLNSIDVPCISILHDIQHWEYSQFFSPKELKHRYQYFQRMIQYSDLIICVSHFSKRSLYDYCHHHDLLPKATSVIYPYFKPSKPLLFNSQADHIQIPLKFLDQTKLNAIPYLLYPANYWPHKNHKLFLQAYAEYLQWYKQWYEQSSPEIPYFHLVFTGTLATEEQEIKRLAQSLNLTEAVHFLGYLDDPAFEIIWHHCQGLIFPSLYEGFGLPIVEAMERSKPILCSQIPALEEVTQGACLYFNPAELESIVTALRSFTLNPELRENLKQQSHDRYHYFQNLKPIDDYLSLFQQLLN